MSETREPPAVRVDLSGVRRRLDGTQGRTYWKSLEELAQTPEFLEFLHRHLTNATENIRADENAAQVTLSFADWQRVLALQMVLARYVRAVSEPEAAEQS